MHSNQALTDRIEALEAELGAISALLVCPSKEATKVVRDCSKHTDNLGVALRKATIEFDKTLVVKNDQNETTENDTKGGTNGNS